MADREPHTAGSDSAPATTPAIATGAEEWAPPGVDSTRPSVARMYDYFLGGKDNFAVDREAARRASAAFPDLPAVARSNRRFLVAAVRCLAEAGMHQFIDLGSGMPTAPNVHEIARAVHPDARVVYIDNDPVVMAHNRALRAVEPGIITVQHDLRTPADILDDPRVTQLIDFQQPVALLFVAVLHFVAHDLSTQVVAQFREAMAPGSHLALSVLCSDGMDETARVQLEAVYANSSAPGYVYDRGRVEALFDGFELLDPGVVDVTQWRSDGTPHSLLGLCGVARRN